MSQRTPSAADQDLDDREAPEEYAAKDEEEAEEDYLAPSRWWIISTLFPLFGATFGPVASAFNICALAGKWIVRVNPSSDESEGSYPSDATWLYAVNAISLAVAVIANLALLAHMTSRIRFSIAQPVTILAFYTACFLLVGITAATPGNLQGPGETLSQGFYYACMAAFLYFVIASLLAVTAYGVFVGRFSREYKLTMAQRSLMFQTTTFVGYLLAAAAVYSRIEGWLYLDAVYFVDVTLFTIGFGDFDPKTHLGRGLFFPMAVGGILFVGLIVASISACVLESGSKKVATRNVEKARMSIMKGMNSKSGTIRVSWFKKPQNIKSAGSTELEQRSHEFHLMRLVQQKASFDNAIIALCISLGLWLSLWFVGAVVFWQAEKGVGDWSYFEALYFTYVSYLTIGYGDFSPNSNSAKPAFVMWSLLALPTLTVLIGAVGNTISEGVNSATLWLAENLPESSGTLRSIKGAASKKKKDKDGDYSAAKPPGFMEEGARGDGDDAASSSRDLAEQSAAVRGMGGDVQAGQGATGHEAAAAANYRPLLLVRELDSVIKHLDASPPRKYTFEEWTWILKLLGEDEADAKYHRSAGKVKDAEKEGDAGEEAKEGDALEGGEPWSWLGRKSPLMSGQDEPRWILEKLVAELKKELKALGDGRQEGKERG